jgi:hypothetical protein
MILGGLGAALRESASTFGHCNACDDAALPLACVICGERTCLRHAWICGDVLTQRALPRVVCSRCIEDIELGDDDERAPWKQAAVPADVPRERRDWARQVLGVSGKSTRKQVTEAYHRLARKYHPDHNPGDVVAEAAFKQIADAYRVLTEKPA